MKDKSSDTSGFWDNLKVKYRVSVIDLESLKELKSYKLSKLGLILSFLGLILTTFLIFLAVFSIKPIKHLVYGIDNVESSSAFIELNKQVVDLESALESQQVYISGLVKMLNGDQEKILESSPKILESLDGGVTSNNSSAKNQQETETSRIIRNKLRHLVSPVRGRVSAEFNALEEHFGIDVIAPKNSPITSVADGVVISADWTIETGNTISIQHADNVISIYKHNSALLKKSGDSVTSGEAIAIIGNSGEQSTGPHLHFELWHQGSPLDPLQFISF